MPRRSPSEETAETRAYARECWHTSGFLSRGNPLPERNTNVDDEQVAGDIPDIFVNTSIAHNWQGLVKIGRSERI